MTLTEQNPWQTLSTREVHATPRLRVREDRVIQPDGEPSTYTVIEFRNMAVGIVALTDDEEVILVGQYRYTLNDYSWELPAGGSPVGQPPLPGAQKELQEETGITAARWTYLGEVHTSNSSTDERAHAYLARDLKLGPSNPEGAEQLRVRRVPFARAVEMALTGEIADALPPARLRGPGLERRRGPPLLGPDRRRSRRPDSRACRYRSLIPTRTAPIAA